MTVDWLHTDDVNTLARVSEIEFGNKKATFPQHAPTHSDCNIFSELDQEDEISNRDMIVVGEPLNQNTLSGVGHEAQVTNDLFSRLKKKMVHGKMNIVYPRIPNTVKQGNNILTIEKIDDLQASALVGLQLDLNANAIIVPVPNNITQKKAFDRIFERTINERKTFNSDKEIIGLIPKTEAIDLIPSIVRDYVKEGIRHFAIDFSGSTIPRAHLRQAVRSIRESLKIRKNEPQKEKQYTLHAFNVSFAVKSQSEISPITDLLTHVYGIDSTSGVIWGGGTIEKDKLRYYNTADYGAYRLGDLSNHNISIPKKILESSPIVAYKKMRVDRIKSYKEECKKISNKISEQDQLKGYAAHINTKDRAKEIVKKVVSDVKEIKAT